MNPHLLIFSQISKTFDIFIFLTNTSERSHSEEISLSSKKRFLGQQHFSNTVRDRVRVKFVCTWQKLAIGREIGKLKSKFCGVPQVPAGGIRKYENSIRSRPDYTPHRLKLLGYGLLWLGCAPPWETKSTLESIPSFFFDNPFSLGKRNFRSSLFLYRNQKFFFSTDICSRDSWKKFGPYLFAISNLHIERKKKRIKFELHISFPIRKEILLKCVNFGKSLIRMEIASCNLIFSRVKK